MHNAELGTLRCDQGWQASLSHVKKMCVIANTHEEGHLVVKQLCLRSSNLYSDTYFAILANRLFRNLVGSMWDGGKSGTNLKWWERRQHIWHQRSKHWSASGMLQHGCVLKKGNSSAGKLVALNPLQTCSVGSVVRCFTKLPPQGSLPLFLMLLTDRHPCRRWY